jgi:hypothetical protein
VDFSHGLEKLIQAADGGTLFSLRRFELILGDAQHLHDYCRRHRLARELAARAKKIFQTEKSI